MADIKLRVPALGEPVAGVPVALGGAGGPPAGVGAPPVAIAAVALPGRIASRAATATVNNIPANLGRALDVLGTTFPLFRPPAELAVGLALKEIALRNVFVRFAPETCKGPCGSPAPIGTVQMGFGVLRGSIGAAVDGRHATLRRVCDYHPLAAREVLCAAFPRMKTYVATPADRQRDWYVVDAEGQTLGRLATRIADALRGKRKPEYTPHIDTGDFIVVVNAEKIHVTGDKLAQKTYWRHSGYPGGIKSRTLAEMLERRPEEVIRKAVKGMLPRNRLARQQLTKLKVYAGPDHPHAAQQPKPMEIEK